MQTNNHVALIRFVLTHADSAPLTERIAVYRGLADLSGDAEETKELTQLANELEAAQRHSEQFVFRFHQRTH